MTKLFLYCFSFHFVIFLGHFFSMFDFQFNLLHSLSAYKDKIEVILLHRVFVCVQKIRFSCHLCQAHCAYSLNRLQSKTEQLDLSLSFPT